jgi:hypothetical protein
VGCLVVVLFSRFLPVQVQGLEGNQKKKIMSSIWKQHKPASIGFFFPFGWSRSVGNKSD